MRIGRSIVGWLFVAVYVVAFAWACRDAMAKRGTFLYDLGLNLLAIPYILVGRLLTRDATFEVHASEPWGLLPALLFCSALALMLGAAIESMYRRATARFRSGTSGSGA